ncbi:MAG TPA: response regulator [Bryobacteraceae bacterium]|nr:response regulator [Bryobacteraceae bacterium]
MERADLEQWKAREVARLLALVETERRYYQEIVATIPVGLLVLSTDLSIISANRAIKKIFGLRSGDALRGRLDALLPGWLLDRVEEVLKTGTAQTGLLVETEHEGKRTYRVAIQAIRNWDDEAAQEALLTIEDLSGVEIASQPVVEVPVPAAAEPQGFPASELIDNLNAVVWAAELPGMNFLFASKHAQGVLGYAADHWIGNAGFWADRVYEGDRDWVMQSYQRAIERGEGHACEFRAVAADGKLVWLRESARLLKDAEGHPNYLIGVAVDVTERRQLEEQLVQSERVEAVSRLASRMAHDLNNMLMILTGYGEELLNGIPAGSPQRSDVQEMLTATERMTTLTNQLLAFSRRQPQAVHPVELEKVLSSVADRLRVLLGQGIELQVSLADAPSMVKADAPALEQVVASLVERARQAMHGQGRITMETSSVEIAEDLRRAEEPLRPGSYGVITISYTGRPLEGEARVMLFESVLPGKEPWDDAAAAATRAYGIVRQWGGDISVSSGAVEGSVFRIFLERVEEHVAAPEPQAAIVEPEPPPVEPEKPLETILVVEDEAGIRALVRKILRRQGYEVLEAGNGEEALALAASHSGNLDLLITDVMMPQMGGHELADRLREQHRDVKVLYVSGYTDDAAIYAGNLPPGTAFLQKPFTLGSLLDKVKEVLSVKA